MSKRRIDMITYKLDEKNSNHVIQMLELTTCFDYTYSSNIVGNSWDDLH